MRVGRGTTLTLGSWVLSLCLVGCYRGADGGRDGSDPPQDDVDGDGEGTGDGTVDEPLPSQPLHRLNRLEYDNTVRDLLGTSLRPAATFGPDPATNGFDNNARGLQMDASLLDGYERAALDVVTDALDDVPVFSATFEGDAIDIPGGYTVGELWALSGNPLVVTFTVPQYAEAELVLVGGASLVGPAPAPTAQLLVNGVALPGFTMEGTAAAPSTRVEPLTLAAGVHTIELHPTNFVNDPVTNYSNNVLVRSLTIRSIATRPGPGRDLVYVCEPFGPADVDCYGKIIERFAFRAWRRPLDEAERAGLVDLWSRLVEGGEGPDQALRLVMRAVMISPKFLYRARTDTDADADGWLDPYVLASRLSYFVWSSMPDDRLFDMAADGSLTTDEGLSEAVAFMLADDKANALGDGFAEQWLSTRHLANAEPDPDVYPSFDEEVRAAMTAESKLLFTDFLDNGLAVSAVVRPDFAYRNDRLALHYGLAEVGSDEMVRVPVADGERAGLLSLGAWLTATSDATHASPIRRGRWVAETLMCNPVPAPPPGLEFEPPDLDDATTVREQLEMHRADPGCNSCHQLLDVVGIGFQDYDGVASPILGEVDNLGELPDGTTFEGAEELSELYADSDDFVGCLTDKLFTYAVGREIDDPDEADLEAIARQAHAAGWDLPQLIDALVHTPSFRSPGPLATDDPAADGAEGDTE